MQGRRAWAGWIWRSTGPRASFGGPSWPSWQGSFAGRLQGLLHLERVERAGAEHHAAVEVGRGAKEEEHDAGAQEQHDRLDDLAAALVAHGFGVPLVGEGRREDDEAD